MTRLSPRAARKPDRAFTQALPPHGEPHLIRLPDWALAIPEVHERMSDLCTAHCASRCDIDLVDGQWLVTLPTTGASLRTDAHGIVTLSLCRDDDEAIPDLSEMLCAWHVPHDARADGRTEGPVLSGSFSFLRVTADGRPFGLWEGDERLGQAPSPARILEMLRGGHTEALIQELEAHLSDRPTPEPIEASGGPAPVRAQAALGALSRCRWHEDEVCEALISVARTFPISKDVIRSCSLVRQELCCSLAHWVDVERVGAVLRALGFAPEPGDLALLDAVGGPGHPSWLPRPAPPAFGPRSQTVAHLRRLASKGAGSANVVQLADLREHGRLPGRAA